jgi:hypothetical protein
MPQAAGMAVGAGLNFLGGRKAARAAQDAANAQLGYGDVAAKDVMSGSDQAANEFQNQRNTNGDVYTQQVQNLAPWLSGGNIALNALSGDVQNGTGVAAQWDKQFDPNSVQIDPGYAFRAAEGQKALERSAAARGGVMSGGTLKSLARYSQGLASQEYQNAYNRAQQQYQQAYDMFRGNQQQRMNALMPLANFGYGATGQFNQAAGEYGQMQNQVAQNLANVWENRAQNLANIRLGQGAVKAGGIVGAGNAYGNMLGQLGNMGMQYGMMRSLNQFGGKPNWGAVNSTLMNNPTDVMNSVQSFPIPGSL